MSLMTNEAKHINICLSAIWISSLLKCLSKSLADFKGRLLVFFILICRFYYIYNNNSPFICIANIFSHGETYLFITYLSQGLTNYGWHANTGPSVCVQYNVMKINHMNSFIYCSWPLSCNDSSWVVGTKIILPTISGPLQEK